MIPTSKSLLTPLRLVLPLALLMPAGGAAQGREVEDQTYFERVEVTVVNVEVFVTDKKGRPIKGLGQALKEEVLLREGQILNPSLLAYLVPTSLETPQMQRGHVVTNEPKGPFGAKEVGEGAIAGVLAAVANAVYDAAGARIKSLPVTPGKVLRAMEERQS